ncbi:DUF2336 domain-containing protein [Roseomonas fluvialis]|uniref:DUF2336 domain-containing protein n=1 Tax=Roseomonas fluvialis TaxID=1750527 RepID=A0ABN6NWC5_9PROT|nr:DUF2336 domain-containing protein [Roseomonas fluvialis]BDG70193.1 hypothetical protein Rmf_01220 [Roseomonas fluvialis]
MIDLGAAARILDEGRAPGRTEARAALAAHPQAPPEALYYLAGDDDAAVRRAVAGNPATPHQSFAVLAGDGEQEVRAMLAHRLAALAPDLAPAQQDRLAHMAWSALAQLAADTVAEIRATIAEAVKDLPDAPREMVRALAADRDIRVAGPVIRLSPLLAEEDLLALVDAPPLRETLTAVARRPGISETVADALVATGDALAIGTLLRNHTAAIRESTLDALVVQAAEHTAWQEPLVRRPYLPPRAAVALAAFIAEELLAPLAARTDLPAQATAQVRAAVATRLAGAAREGESAADSANRAAILADAGALNDAVLLRAAHGGEVAFVAAALATLSRMPRSAIDHAIATRCAKSVAGMCRQAGLAAATAEAVAALLAPGMPGATSVAPSLVGDGELRWRVDALARAAARSP